MKFRGILLGIFLTTNALAGGAGWESSGGEIFRGAKNPWFVTNTPAVQYCIQFDSASMNANVDQARRLIQDGLAYWKTEFSRTTHVNKGFVDLATQTFTEVPCSLGVAQMEFLFGYGSLNSERLAYLASPEKFVGVSVRTDYDSKNLRGKGFVYITSDVGPHAYSAGDANIGLIPNAWKNERLLAYAILHELGHVFGIPHTGAGLMSEVFLEQLLNPRVYEVFLTEPIDSFFFPAATMESCGQLAGADKAFFGADLDSDCLQFRMLGPDQPISVFAKKKAEANWKPVGVFENVTPNLFDTRNLPAVHVELPPDQTVFTSQAANFKSFMIGGMFYDAGFGASYRAFASPVPKSAYVKITSDSLYVIANVGGKTKTVFNYSSWIATKLYLSDQ